jgi:hypothetical protein
MQNVVAADYEYFDLLGHVTYLRVQDYKIVYTTNLTHMVFWKVYDDGN